MGDMALHQIGNATLYHGDCLKIMPTIPAESVDFCITDPPYSSGGLMRGDRMQSTQAKYVTSNAATKCRNFTGNRDQRSYLAWSTLWMGEVMAALKPGGIFATFTDWRQLPITTDAVQCAGFVWRGVGVWAKGAGTSRPVLGRYKNQCEYVVWGTKGDRKMEGQTAPGVVFASSPPVTKRMHITEKPVEVCEWLLSVTNEGDTILDPFMGSASLGESCQRLGRRYIGIELNDHYFSVACKRIANTRQLF